MKTKRHISGLLALATAVIFGGCPSEEEDNNEANSALSCEGDLCTLTGEITEDLTLSADKEYVLKGGVFVGDDTNATTLTIEPGTTIYGDPSTLSFLVIRRHAKLMAQGTADKPIIFTSGKDDGKRARGDWGGIIINGQAPLNVCAAGTALCEAEGEGNTGKYGGSKADDNSGVLKYVRVEFGGQQITSDNELNGIAFQGVGAGTTVDHVQVHMSKDDGVEFFGGTVNAKHLLITGAGDDSIDWTDGWQGKLQYAIVQQYDDDGDNGIEADNNGDNNTAAPRSKPTLSNITLIGSPASSSSDLGMLLREGTGANIYNTLVLAFNEACISMDQDETFSAGEVSFTRVIAHCATSVDFCDVRDVTAKSADGDKKSCTSEGIDAAAVEALFTEGSGNQQVDPQLGAPTDLSAPDFAPKAGSPALGAGQAPSESFFEAADFIGAVGAQRWYEGWTTAVKN